MKTSLLLTALVALIGCTNARINLGPDDGSAGSGGTDTSGTHTSAISTGGKPTTPTSGGTTSGGTTRGGTTSGGATGGNGTTSGTSTTGGQTTFPGISVEGLKRLTLTTEGGMPTSLVEPFVSSVNFETGDLTYAPCLRQPDNSVSCTDYSRNLTNNERTAVKMVLARVTAPKASCGIDASTEIIKLDYADRSLSYEDDFYSNCSHSDPENSIPFAHDVKVVHDFVRQTAYRMRIPLEYDYFVLRIDNGLAWDESCQTTRNGEFYTVHADGSIERHWCPQTGNAVVTVGARLTEDALDDLKSQIIDLKLGATNDCADHREIPNIAFFVGDVTSQFYGEQAACPWSTTTALSFVVGLDAIVSTLRAHF
jgi:hypothetical protein